MAQQDDLVDLGQDPAGERAVPLEEKYREQMRQIVSQKIELPISTLVDMIEEQIDLDPDFQRRDRWDQYKQSRFVASIIMNVPIPPSFRGRSIRQICRPRWSATPHGHLHFPPKKTNIL